MLQVIQEYKSGKLSVQDLPPPALTPGGVLVRNYYSLISAGTERTTVQTAQKTILGKAQSRPDLVEKVVRMAKTQGLQQTIEIVRNKLNTQLPLGYSSSGIVIETGHEVQDISVGDRVACAGQGYASHAEIVFVPQNLVTVLPDNVEYSEGAFTTLGAIAMQGVRQSNAEVGQIVCVIGLGLIGQLTVQILKAAGCTVIGIDPDPVARTKALELGADKALSSSDDWQPTLEYITRGYGVDSAILCAGTSSNEPVITAGTLLRDKGILVIVGAVPADIPRSPFYEKEIDIRFSRSYGPGRYDIMYEEGGFDYPYGYVRWTENRNMSAFLKLVSDRRIHLGPLMSHTFPIERATEAYGLITNPKMERSFGVLLDYSHRVKEEIEPRLVVAGQTPKTYEGVIGVGFIGAGSFAQNFLLPHLKKTKKARLIGVCNNKGISAASVAKRFRFGFATTDRQEILSHSDIDTVFIATRHHLHAQLTVEALRQGKAVFVEKPLALSRAEVENVVNVQRETQGRVMVGFNRRFAPTVVEIKKFFEKRIQPAVITYRINAGFVPKDHWIQDSVEGGGRIIGEICHFVDLLNFLTNSLPIKIHADVISSNREDLVAKDNVGITIKYRDGSIAQILYVAVGDRSFPKERIEMYAEQSVAVIDDFRTVSFSRHGKTKTLGSRKQQKGYAECLNAFLSNLKAGKEMPIPFQESVHATLATLSILDSLQCGLPVEVRLDDRQQFLNRIVNRFQPES